MFLIINGQFDKISQLTNKNAKEDEGKALYVHYYRYLIN